MDEGFLPEGYKVPKSGGAYMKFADGSNKFRFLSKPIVGWEYWTEGRKPVRARKLWDVIPADADISQGWRPKHFWAFAVWNYAEHAVQVLEVTQATILGQFSDLIANNDWGDPRGYDITVIRKGQALDTEYTVQPSPHKPLHPDIQLAFEEKKLKLEALFEGGDPFGGEATVRDRKDDEEFAGKIEPPEIVKRNTPPAEPVVNLDEPPF